MATASKKMIRATGLIDSRKISAADWKAAGLTDAKPVSWDASNGRAVPVSEFSAEQVEILKNTPGFVVEE